MNKELRENMMDVLEMAYGYVGVKEKHNPVINELINLILDEAYNKIAPIQATHLSGMYIKDKVIEALEQLKGISDDTQG